METFMYSQALTICDLVCDEICDFAYLTDVSVVDKLISSLTQNNVYHYPFNAKVETLLHDQETCIEMTPLIR